MELTAKQVADLLGLPETTIKRWVRQGSIPTRKKGNRFLFSKKEILAWAKTNRMTLVQPAQCKSSDSGCTKQSLSQALENGGVFYQVPGHDVKSVLEQAASRLPISEERRASLLGFLLEREDLSSTGIGKGVAIPHPRVPRDDEDAAPLITTCFLESPVDYSAVDGRPVFVLFVLLCPSTKVHLTMLSKLAFCLRDDKFVQFLEATPAADDLISEVSRREQTA